MKKLIAFLFSGAVITPTFCQTCEGPALLSENFDNGTIPATWTILDLDGNTLIWNMPGKGWTGQWQPYYHAGRKGVANTCRFTSGGTADDYLITPAISLGPAPVCLSWIASSQYAFSPENYEIRISTTAPTAAGMQVQPALSVITGEMGQWTEHSVDLSAYAGQTVYIGFWYNSSATYSVFIDDIRIASPVNLDGKAALVKMEDVLLPAVAQPINVTFQNGGLTAITSFNMNWKVDNGPVNTMTISSVNVTPSTYYSFTHSTTWTPSASGTYTLRVWPSNPNGTADQNTANDTLIRTVYVNTVPRKVLIEEFTNASCPPCASQNPGFNALTYQNRLAGKVTSLHYQVVWPGTDPMNAFNQQDVEQQVQYYGVGGVPTGVLDGVYIPDSCSLYEGAPGCLTQTMINKAQAVPAIFDIQIASVKNGNTGNVSVTVLAKNTFTTTNFRLITALLEDTISYSSPPGSNGELDFYQVMRHLLPDSDGVFLPAMTAGQSLTYTSSFTVDPGFVENQLRVLAFVQDDATRKVYQSNMINSPYGVTANNESGRENSDCRVYPNPAHDEVIFMLSGWEGDFTVEIKNVLSQKTEFFFQGNTAGGTYRKGIPIGQLSPGLYQVEVYAEEKRIVKKLVKQ